MARFSNVLAAVDFSPTSQEALATAVAVSRAEGGRLHALHVVPDVHVPFTIEPVAFDFASVVQEQVAAARQRLTASLAPFAANGGLVTIAVVSGAPAGEILRYAAAHDIDLIVVGRHGHGFVDRWLMGSVSERVARHAPSVVLVVPDAPHRAASPDVHASGVSA